MFFCWLAGSGCGFITSDTRSVLPDSRCSSYPQEVYRDSPTAYWRLSETSGTSAGDSSGYGFTGTYTGTFTLGIAGALLGDANAAASFDGATGYVTGPTLPNIGASANATVEAWVKPNVVTGGIINVLTNGLGAVCFNYGLILNSNVTTYQLYGRNGVGNYALGGVVSLNTWTHVAVVFSAAGATGYVNGIAIGSNGASTTQNCVGGALFISKRPDPQVGEHFPGGIDEVAVYPSALSQSRLLNHYNMGLGACR